MKVISLQKSSRVYACNSYLILGDWNRIEDINTVIDPGTDGFILQEIEQISTGVGKAAVGQVILTHNHFDHCAAVPFLKNRYGCKVLAFCEGPGVDVVVKDGEFIKAGDQLLKVLHTPGHTTDSICLYVAGKKAIFSGDTRLLVNAQGGTFPLEYVAATRRLHDREITTVYTGHDGIVLGGPP